MSARLFFNLIFAMTFIGLFVGCAPTKSDSQTQTANAQSSGILGGVDSTAAYQKENGVVGFYIFSKDAKENMSVAICSGSLIRHDVVLTAAHCLVVPEGNTFVSIMVFLGVDSKEIMDQVQNNDLANVRGVKNAILHERYDGSGPNDIALLLLTSEAPANYAIAQLPSSVPGLKVEKGSLLSFAGFGVSTYEISTKKNNVGGDGRLRHVVGIPVLGLMSQNTEIVLDQSGGKAACHGDSGGPAYLQDPKTKKNVLVGITSRGEEPCNSRIIYGSVAAFERWIDTNIPKLTEESVQ